MPPHFTVGYFSRSWLFLLCWSLCCLWPLACFYRCEHEQYFRKSTELTINHPRFKHRLVCPIRWLLAPHEPKVHVADHCRGCCHFCDGYVGIIHVLYAAYILGNCDLCIVGWSLMILNKYLLQALPPPQRQVFILSGLLQAEMKKYLRIRRILKDIFNKIRNKEKTKNLLARIKTFF